MCSAIFSRGSRSRPSLSESWHSSTSCDCSTAHRLVSMSRGLLFASGLPAACHRNLARGFPVVPRCPHARLDVGAWRFFFLPAVRVSLAPSCSISIAIADSAVGASRRHHSPSPLYSGERPGALTLSPDYRGEGIDAWKESAAGALHWRNANAVSDSADGGTGGTTLFPLYRYSVTLTCFRSEMQTVTQILATGKNVVFEKWHRDLQPHGNQL